MAGLIAGHVGEAFSQQRILVLDAAAELLVQQKSGKLGGAALLQKLDEYLACFGVELVSSAVESFVTHKVMAVVVLTELLADGFQFLFIRPQIHGRHGLEICGVKTRCKDRVPDRIFHRRSLRRTQPRKLLAGGGAGCGDGRNHRAALQTVCGAIVGGMGPSGSGCDGPGPAL